jgi:hypothetical protein
MTAVSAHPISADQVAYNHDIDVSPAYAASFPLIQDILRDKALIQAFHLEDTKARADKNHFLKLGAIAVVLGVLPLLCDPLVVGLEFSSWPLLLVALVAEACGVASLVLIILARTKGYRDRWRRAMFARERMRQWHFQLFLDGPFIQLASTNPKEFREELARRWAQFRESVSATHNALQTFTDDHYHDSDLYTPPAPYTDPAVADEVWRALSEIRFRHQIGHAGIQLDPDGAGQFLPAPKKREFLEAVAGGSLLAAIGVTVAFFGVDSAIGLCRALNWNDALFQPVPMLLLRFAMFFTALSAGSRAFKAGLTLPEEMESYDYYRAEVLQLSRLYAAAASAEQKLEVLADLEREASRELRRFLKMKARATFII